MSTTAYTPFSIRAALFTLLSLLPSLLLAQQDTRWYQVEIIAFAQNSAAYHKSELWPHDFTPPNIAKSRELARSRVDTTQASSQLPPPFSRITSSSLRLHNTAKRMEKAGDLELLLHTGWIQPGLPENKAVAVHLYEGMDSGLAASAQGTPPRFDGTLRLILSRYLHLESDLIWRDPIEAVNTPAETPAAENSNLSDNAIAGTSMAADAPVESAPLETGYQVYRLQQSRRMRSKEIHYIDHPRFGLVVLVTPYNVE